MRLLKERPVAKQLDLKLEEPPPNRWQLFVEWLFDGLTPGMPVVSTVGASSLKSPASIWRGVVFVVLVVGLMAMGRGAWADSPSDQSTIQTNIDESSVVIAETASEGLVELPLDKSEWNSVTHDALKGYLEFQPTVTNTSEGLILYAYSYRVGTHTRSANTFNFIDTEIFIKWKGNGGKKFAGFGVGIDGPSIGRWYGIINTSLPKGGFTSHHSWSNSIILQEDVWYYSRIKINSDFSYTITTALNAYDSLEGNIVDSKSGFIRENDREDIKNGRISAHLVDTYGSTNAYMVIGEVKMLGNIEPTTENVVACGGITDGLVACYPFDGNANDESGNGNDGMVVGDTSYATGKIGQAASFDGAGDYIRIPQSDSLKGLDELTIAYWVKYYKPVSGHSNVSVTITNGPDMMSGDGFFTYAGSDGISHHLGKWGDAVAASVPLNAKEPLSKQKFVFAVFSADADTIRSYQNGVIVEEKDRKNKSASGRPGTDWFVGYHGVKSYPYYLNGNIDDLRIYNRALSDCEIKSLYTGKDECISQTACQLYGVHDEGLNNTQFFTVSPETFEVKALGEMRKAHDIEALDIHPQTAELFAASGKDTKIKGHLYQLNGQTGALTSIGPTGFKEIDGLSFHPDGTLWGWATGDGLVTIDTTTGQAKLVVAHPGEIEDLTWNTAGTILFGVENVQNNPDAGVKLLAYDGNTVETVCEELTQSLEIEALDTLPDDTLLFGIHSKTGLPIGTIDVTTCQIIAKQEIATDYNDVEGLAWSAFSCNPSNDAQDNTQEDNTQDDVQDDVQSACQTIEIPAIDPSATGVSSSVIQSLYTGDNPIQTGIESEAISFEHAAVIHGMVTNVAGEPLTNVNVTLKRHPEYGQTVTTCDGNFNMVANAGDTLTINYQKAGYLPIQRELETTRQQYAVVDTIVMRELDPVVTRIDLTANTPIQVAQSSVVTDEAGTRQAMVLFPQGTTATMTLPDGSTQALTQLDVRATEYTVGENKQQTMPALLPPDGEFDGLDTYAVELSVDQAIAAGATHVDFSQPVMLYVDNFLEFPVGINIPMAWYDYVESAWIPSDDGRVINIIGIENGLAVLDVEGNGQAASASTLAELGITEAERQQLASHYAVGKSLWRAPITHFTPVGIMEGVFSTIVIAILSSASIDFIDWNIANGLATQFFLNFLGNGGKVGKATSAVLGRLVMLDAIFRIFSRPFLIIGFFLIAKNDFDFYKEMLTSGMGAVFGSYHKYTAFDHIKWECYGKNFDEAMNNITEKGLENLSLGEIGLLPEFHVLTLFQKPKVLEPKFFEYSDKEKFFKALIASSKGVFLTEDGKQCKNEPKFKEEGSRIVW